MNPTVVMATSLGLVTFELLEDKAPVTVENFLGYVADGHYDNTVIHRVIPHFMIQGGGYEPGMKQKATREPIKNESGNGLANARGTLAAARTSIPDSATAQFFINVVDNGFLDRAHAQDGVGYCVFGLVINGMDVVDRITRVPTESKHGHLNVPVEDVVIRWAIDLRDVQQRHIGDETVPGLVASLAQPNCEFHLWSILADRLEEIGSPLAAPIRKAAARK